MQITFTEDMRLTQHPKLTVVILNYNGLRWLPTCISSVLKTDYPKTDIYLVDNGSSDRSVTYIHQTFPLVKLILNKRNLGFAEGYNKAVRQINANHLILLNADTEILEPRWIRYLVEAVESDDRIAAVACKMVSMEDNTRLDSVGGMGIPYWRGFVDIGRAEYDRGQYDHPAFEPFAFCGGAVLLKRDVFLKLGGFDETFFLFMEDVDLSWRLRLRGYHLALAPKALVAHYSGGSSTSRDVDALKLYHCHKNLLRSILKNCGTSLGGALRTYLLFSVIVATGIVMLEPKKTLAIVKAVLWNIAHFKDTYRRRFKIQEERIVGEKEILERMYPRLKRYQPPERVKHRRILNTLFEYGQSFPKAD